MYDKISELEDAAYNLQNQINGAYANKISADQVYKILLNFEKLYDKMTDKEKKEFMQLFIERINIPKEKVTGWNHQMNDIDRRETLEAKL